VAEVVAPSLRTDAPRERRSTPSQVVLETCEVGGPRSVLVSVHTGVQWRASSAYPCAGTADDVSVSPGAAIRPNHNAITPTMTEMTRFTAHLGVAGGRALHRW